MTPPLDEGVLAGIVRARVLALAPGLGLEASERPVTPEDLAQAEAVFLTNSLRAGRAGAADRGAGLCQRRASGGAGPARALSREIAQACGMAVGADGARPCRHDGAVPERRGTENPLSRAGASGFTRLL